MTAFLLIASWTKSTTNIPAGPCDKFRDLGFAADNIDVKSEKIECQVRDKATRTPVLVVSGSSLSRSGSLTSIGAILDSKTSGSFSNTWFAGTQPHAAIVFLLVTTLAKDLAQALHTIGAMSVYVTVIDIPILILC